MNNLHKIPHLNGHLILRGLRCYDGWRRLLPDTEAKTYTTFACDVLNTISGGALQDALWKVLARATVRLEDLRKLGEPDADRNRNPVVQLGANSRT